MDGKLLIGFRNPVPQGKALVIPLNNPRELIEGGTNPAVRASFGEAIELDLHGQGIRSIELVGTEYYIVAGPVDDEGSFGVYCWSGNENASPVRMQVPALEGLHPESLIVPAAGETADSERRWQPKDRRHGVQGLAERGAPLSQRDHRPVSAKYCNCN